MYAESEEHARKIVLDAHEHMKEFKIVDLYKLTEEDRKKWEVSEDAPEEAKKVLN